MGTMSSKGVATRERMLDTAIDLMRGSGLTGAGINEIVKAGRTPKGSVYHFFPQGKQQIATEALDVHAARVDAAIRQALAAARTPTTRVQALFALFARRLEEGGYLRSCAAGAACVDLGADDEPVREAVEAAFERWGETIASHFDFGDRRLERSFAGLLLSAIQGAYIRGRAERSGAAFADAGRWLGELARARSRQ